MPRSILRHLADAVKRWPMARQITESGTGAAAVSDETRALRSRLRGTLVHVKGTTVVDVEGDPNSPINHGTLCPKGADIYQYTVNEHRLTTTLYRPPGGTQWEQVSLDWAMQRIADRMQETRDRTWTSADEKGRPLRHTTAIGFLGGAALDNEENYLIKKLCVGLGIVAVENQARI
jgi:formate dehydrogenase major subunit